MTVSAGKGAVGNLPAQFASFVGRSEELANVKQALSTSRLVTLVGPGGVGKTRLALQVAADAQRAFQDGAWFVDISQLRDEELLAPTIAAALGLQSRSTRWAPAVLGRQLAKRSMLLIIDNCEYLTDACVVLVDTLLKACPNLKVLITSRQPLEISGEYILAIEPLSTPEEGEPIPALSELEKYGAIRLFLERARTTEPRFEITEENAATIVTLCRRLDGLPLALELAAARVRHLSPGHILERLDERYLLLRTNSRVAAPRQRSLRSLIEWSFDLCSPEERTLWSRLTVFSGSFSAQAAEFVCAGGELAQDEVLETLARLVDKSIVATVRHTSEVRYRMLETIRAFGREQLLTTGDELVYRRRHRDYFSDLLGKSYPQWFGPKQDEILSWIPVERDNLRAAIDFCLSEPDEAGSAVLIATGLGGEAFLNGFQGESRHWIDRALDMVRRPCAERARLLWIDGWCVLHQGDAESAQQLLEECREIARRVGDPQELAMGTAFLGIVRMARGADRDALGLFDEALDLMNDRDAPMCRAIVLVRKGAVRFQLGDRAAGMQLCREAIAISETHGEKWHRAEALWELGNLSWQDGKNAEAFELTAEALRIHQSFHNAVGTAHCLESLAWIAADSDEPDRAVRLLGAADALLRSTDASLRPQLASHRDRCMSQTRRALDERKYNEVYRIGEWSQVSENVAVALREAREPENVAAAPAGPQLTRREWEIAELIADGISNREIAAKLVISPRTAEGHVVHILGKLGFTSRVQIAAWMTERRAAGSV